MYKVQLYKEDLTILQMLGCQGVVIPSTEQIVKGWSPNDQLSEGDSNV